MSVGSESVNTTVVVETAVVSLRALAVAVVVEAILPTPTPLTTRKVQTGVRSRLFARPPPHLARRRASKPCSVRRARLRAVSGGI